tara:strand:- start:206 stop:568 length:363 start_codon:yes stop_codon:yes gene_type:complete
MSKITRIVEEYIQSNIPIQNILKARIGHFIELLGRIPTLHECQLILKSAVITNYALLYEDFVCESKEQGIAYPSEYASRMLQDLALTDWEALFPSILPLVKEVNLHSGRWQLDLELVRNV